MKKFRCMALLVAVSLVVSMFSILTVSAAGEPGYVYDFYYKDEYDNYAITGAAGCTVEWENNALKMVCDGTSDIGDQFFYCNDIVNDLIDAEDYPYIAVNLMNPTDAVEFESHFGTSLHPISGSTVFHFDIDPNMTEYKTYICNIPEQNVINVNRINGPDGICAEAGATANLVPEMEEGGSYWEGTINTLRIDGTYRGGVSGESIEGDTLYICWIAFFETKEDAEAYAGPDHSEIRTPAPTEEPGEVVINKVPGGYLLLNEETDANDMLFGSYRSLVEDVYYDSEKGCYSISFSAGGDPFMELAFGTLISMGKMDEVSADDYKVMQMGVVINPEEGAKSGNIYYGTDLHPGYAEAQNIAYNYAETTDFQIFNVDFSKATAWEGVVGNTRFDAFPENKADTVVDVYYIAFFTNIESAEAFAADYAEKGMDAFPAAPTKAPTKEPTATPEATATPAPTDVPEATDAPAATEAAATENAAEEKNTESKFPVVPVVIVAAVVIAAVVAGILISKAKKKKA